jgi:hypothetical protein
MAFGAAAIEVKVFDRLKALRPVLAGPRLADRSALRHRASPRRELSRPGLRGCRPKVSILAEGLVGRKASWSVKKSSDEGTRLTYTSSRLTRRGAGREVASV